MTIKRAAEGAWIFLSHSTKDFLKVSSLRNELESRGHRPLMFFLKCLDDNCEIDGLIKREIQARTWFILCQSINADSSRWVKSEVSYVKSLPDKVYIEVDLELPLTAQLQDAEPLLRRASVFISYAAADQAAAASLASALRANDFGVFSDLDLSPASAWAGVFRKQLEEAVDRGFVILLLSHAFIGSSFALQEAQTALTWAAERRHRANVIPVYLGTGLDELAIMGGRQFQQILRSVQGFEVRATERPDSFSGLVESLKRRPMVE
jgi:hypothetical protein